MDSYNQPQYDQSQYGYSDSSAGGGFLSGLLYSKRLNALEIGLIILCILTLIGVFLWGFNNQNAINRDKQRATDIFSVAQALDEFYKNTALVPSQRFYPKAPCSESLNEVDFEFTLRNFLTGNVPEIDTHSYVLSDNFPRDRWGEYSKGLTQRKVDYRCTEKISSDLVNKGLIYADGYETCNFSKKLSYKKCYLYTSSSNGDTYKMSYFKEETNKFMIYEKFRDDPIRVSSE